MAIRTGRGEIMHPVEVDLLCAYVDVQAPFPLEIPSVGLTAVEREVMFTGAREQLTERGLADENGPLGVADDFVYLLQRATGVLDLVLTEQRPTLGAAVLAYRDEALLVTQDATDPNRIVRMTACTLDEAIDEAMAMIPALEASNFAPFTLPRRSIEAAYESMLERLPREPDGEVSEMDRTVEIVRPEPMRGEEIDELLHEKGIDERVARKMVSHMQPVLGSGQAGVARRDDTEDQWQRAGDELRWLDTPRGRMKLVEDGEWISVNPLPADELRAGLRRLAGLIRG
jgi:hypothetical protein